MLENSGASLLLAVGFRFLQGVQNETHTLLLGQARNCESRRIVGFQQSVDYYLCLMPGETVYVESIITLKFTYPGSEVIIENV